MGSLCVGGEGGMSVWWVCGGIKFCSMCSREDFCSKWSYGHSGIQAGRDSTLFSIDINQMDISHSYAVCEMNSSHVPRRKGSWIIEQ